MPRSFNGTDSRIILAPAGAQNLAGGPITVATFCKFSDVSDGGLLIARDSGGASKWGLAVSSGDYYQIGASITFAGIPCSTAEGWQLSGMSKASGTVAPRGHKYVCGTDAWTHVNSSSTSANAGAPGSGGSIELGRLEEYGEYFNGDMAWAAIWDRVLTDAEFEALAFGWWQVLASGPVSAVDLSQHATTQAVVDSVGGCNQTSQLNAGVSTLSVPSFGFGVRSRMLSHPTETAVNTGDTAVGGVVAVATSSSSSALAKADTAIGGVVGVVGDPATSGVGIQSDATGAGPLPSSAVATSTVNSGSVATGGIVWIAGAPAEGSGAKEEAAIGGVVSVPSSVSASAGETASIAVGSSVSSLPPSSAQGAIDLATTVVGGGGWLTSSVVVSGAEDSDTAVGVSLVSVVSGSGQSTYESESTVVGSGPWVATGSSASIGDRADGVLPESLWPQGGPAASEMAGPGAQDRADTVVGSGLAVLGVSVSTEMSYASTARGSGPWLTPSGAISSFGLASAAVGDGVWPSGSSTVSVIGQSHAVVGGVAAWSAGASVYIALDNVVSAVGCGGWPFGSTAFSAFSTGQPLSVDWYAYLDPVQVTAEIAPMAIHAGVDPLSVHSDLD